MQHMAPSPLASTVEARYPYRDRQGRLLYEVVRHYPKCFEVVDLDGAVLPDGTIPVYVLYRLPELLAAPLGETIWFVEGEKDVETLRAAGLIATTNPGGARHGWRKHYADGLRGRHVVIVPDADKPGQRLAERVAAGLRGEAASVVTLHLPIHGRDDVSDWLGRRGNVPRLWELAAKARYDAAGIASKPDKRELVFAARLDALGKLILLDLHQRSTHRTTAGSIVDGTPPIHADYARTTAREIASRCGCHRVTAQRSLTALERQGLLRRRGDDWLLVWDVLAMLSIPSLDAVRPQATARSADVDSDGEPTDVRRVCPRV
ncbi:MAG TPA: hypothetical protein VMG10_13025 [Gemmataceae bacterium]|nr:hypothetical protein [Gemmataceae bacterium]